MPHAKQQLIDRFGSQVKPFKELPLTHQFAMIHYMSVDGAAWAVKQSWPDWIWGEGTPYEPELRRRMLADIERHRPRFIQEWGDVLFGVVNIPTADLLEQVFRDEMFDGNREQYRVSEDVNLRDDWEYVEPTWPVILASDCGETLQDGWTRFGRYCQLGVETIPCLYYAE